MVACRAPSGQEQGWMGTYVLRSLEADPADGRPEATLGVAGEGEPLLQFALRAVIGGAAAAAQGCRQLGGVHAVPLTPRQGVVVVGSAVVMARHGVSAHGGLQGRQQGCRRPQEEHPQVTQQDAAAALQHAPAAALLHMRSAFSLEISAFNSPPL